MTDKDTGKSRGFAFVLFDDYDPGESKCDVVVAVVVALAIDAPD